jgi:hypothetical protein
MLSKKKQTLIQHWNVATKADKARIIAFFLAWVLFAVSYGLAVNSTPSVQGAVIVLCVWLFQGLCLCKLYGYEYERIVKRRKWEAINGTPKERFYLMRAIRKREISSDIAWPKMVQQLRDSRRVS